MPDKRDEPYPKDRRSELQAVPLLAERLRKWEEMRQQSELAAKLAADALTATSRALASCPPGELNAAVGRRPVFKAARGGLGCAERRPALFLGDQRVVDYGGWALTGEKHKCTYIYIYIYI